MSNKKDAKNKNNVPKYAQKKKVQDKKKMIIIAASAAAVVALILLAIFVIKPYIDKKKGADGIIQTHAQASDAVTHKYNTNIDITDNGDVDYGYEDSDYEYVDYRGLYMPKQVAEILNQAEIDNAEACKKYGVAISIGDQQVSRPKFEMYYNYVCADKTSESLVLDSQHQMNTTGFDYNKAPFEQKYPGSQDNSYTWAHKFTEDAIENMQFYFAAFEYAVENKIQLTDGQFQRMIYEYEMAIESAENNGLSVEDYISAKVGEHVTYEMYAAHCVMTYYAAEFQTTELEKYAAAVTEEELDKYFKENREYLQVANVRLYPIEAEYTDAQINKVVNEETFLEFAQSTSIYSYYNAESATEYLWVDYNTIGGAFGEEVAKWIFNSDRKAGDIGVVNGSLYECLIYITTPPYEITTHQALVCEYPNSYGATEDIISENKLSADSAQEAYLEYGANKAAALRMVEEMFGFNQAVSVIDYGIEVDKWMFDPARKEGDYTRIDNKDGSYFIVYLNPNPDDYDWVDVARGSMGGERYDIEFEKKVSEDFSPKGKDTEYINVAWNHSYKIMKIFIDDRKSLYGIS